jgi:hypothetical protein
LSKCLSLAHTPIKRKQKRAAAAAATIILKRFRAINFFADPHSSAKYERERQNLFIYAASRAAHLESSALMAQVMDINQLISGCARLRSIWRIDTHTHAASDDNLSEAARDFYLISSMCTHDYYVYYPPPPPSAAAAASSSSVNLLLFAKLTGTQKVVRV